jgi:hypothetical protein
MVSINDILNTNSNYGIFKTENFAQPHYGKCLFDISKICAAWRLRQNN